MCVACVRRRRSIRQLSVLSLEQGAVCRIGRRAGDPETLAEARRRENPRTQKTRIMEYKIHLTDTADAGARQRILASLLMYNAESTGISDYRPLVILITDAQGTVIGGLWGRTALGWLATEMLFVPEGLRGQGIGSQLMAQAEREALARDCHSAWLDTFTFQARGFYERLGYRCFGELNDYPAGFSRHFMQKRLGEEPPQAT